MRLETGARAQKSNPHTDDTHPIFISNFYSAVIQYFKRFTLSKSKPIHALKY